MADEKQPVPGPTKPPAPGIRSTGGKPEKQPVTLRSREQVNQARKGEIIRAMRDAAEADQVADKAWVEELAGLVDVDIRKR